MFFFPVAALLSCALVFTVQSGDGAEIIGGVEVRPHSLPYMALLTGENSFCGGTLINRRWVLTAAHCVGIKQVILGGHSIRSADEEKKSRQYRNVTRWVPHPCYDEDFLLNDLMLLELDRPVRRTRAVEWFDLEEAMVKPVTCSECMTAGWGRACYQAEVGSPMLRATSLTVFLRKTCNQVYNNRPFIPQGTLCAGSHPGDVLQSPWKGDSGGPLVCDEALVGVTSFGAPDKPSVFMYLTNKRLKWIRETTNS